MINPSLSQAADLSNLFIIDCKTKKDFGLHSYYLFNQQPVFDAHTSALNQTEFLLRKISKAQKLYSTIPEKIQHSFYIPVSFKPQSWVTNPSEDDFSAAARWIMHNYDFQCAKKLLTNYIAKVESGPYILSGLSKLSTNNAIPWRSPVLIQNFSNIEANKSLYWLTTFFKKSWQPRVWRVTDQHQLKENMTEDLLRHDARDSDKTTALTTPQIIPMINGEDSPVIATTTDSLEQQNASKGSPVDPAQDSLFPDNQPPASDLNQAQTNNSALTQVENTSIPEPNSPLATSQVETHSVIQQSAPNPYLKRIYIQYELNNTSTTE